MKKTEWNLLDIYATEEDVKRDWEFVERNIEKLKDFKGKLNSEQNILEYLMLEAEISKRLDKIYLMRQLKRSEDILDSKANKQFAEIKALIQKFNNARNFFEVEMLENPIEFLNNMFAHEPKLEPYRIELEDIIKFKDHYLSKEEERILLASSKISTSFIEIYKTFVNGDLKFKDVYDSTGKKYNNPTENELIKYMRLSDRTLRKSAHEAVYASYNDYVHTISRIYLSDVQNRVTNSEIRNYKSYLEKEMEQTDSTVEVYNSLIQAVNENLAIVHRYYKLKKKWMELEKMYIYDKYAPIFSQTGDVKYTYEQAKAMVLNAIEPLGKEYQSVLKEAFESNWAHVYPKKNKEAGTFQNAMYGTHPYVLLNFNGTLDSVGTVAHEFGHAMHSYYTNLVQPYSTAYYSVMVAEVVSTTNEVLLSKNLIKNEKDVLKKIGYLQSDIEIFNSAIIQQTLFAEFEKWVYEDTKKGRALTCEDLCDYYGALVKKYFGEAVEETEGAQYEWARIPYFYRPFYAYKYATGMAAAICISENLYNKGNIYADTYINMLKMGSSVRPLEQLRSVGVDLETEEPIKKAFKYYKGEIDELEKIMKEFSK